MLYLRFVIVSYISQQLHFMVNYNYPNNVMFKLFIYIRPRSCYEGLVINPKYVMLWLVIKKSIVTPGYLFVIKFKLRYVDVICKYPIYNDLQIT